MGASQVVVVKEEAAEPVVSRRSDNDSVIDIPMAAHDAAAETLSS